MQRSCAQCSSAFEVTDGDLALLEKISPVIGGTKQALPPPTLCPFCRMQRRQAHRNTRHLYQNVSAKSGQRLISMYAPDGGYTVYSQKEWWSDDWDPLVYGRDFDASRPFFEQFAELQRAVPRFNVYNRDSENSEYVNYAPHNKNCYLIFGSWFCEDCMYGDTMLECKNCLDAQRLERSELCYEQIDGGNNYASAFAQACSQTADSLFCFDCTGVRNCIGCWNLRNKEYHVWNKPVSPAEFQDLRRKFASHAFLRSFRERFLAEKARHAIHKAVTGHNNEECSGDFLFDCKQIRFGFVGYRCQDIAYSCRFADQKDSMDLEGIARGELVYESLSNDFAYETVACSTSENLKSCHYCDTCFACKDCFGCIALRNRQYCILNRQCTKEEYEALVPKIIAHMRRSGEWGEFFPVRLSPMCYNESIAQEFFPLTEEEAKAHGFRWRAPDAKQHLPQSSALPDTVSEMPDSVTREILACEGCAKNFKITAQELAFYKQQVLPLPRRCPDCRHLDRMALCNPRQLWKRPCGKCGKDMETSYAPKRPEIVYCEACYLAHVS